MNNIYNTLDDITKKYYLFLCLIIISNVILLFIPYDKNSSTFLNIICKLLLLDGLLKIYFKNYIPITFFLVFRGHNIPLSNYITPKILLGTCIGFMCINILLNLSTSNNIDYIILIENFLTIFLTRKLVNSLA
jgi:hypothetical protein